MEENLEEIKKWTPSEWDILVKQEIMTHLNMFLPHTKTFNIGVKYSHPITAKMEDGTTIEDKENAKGVQLILDFDFIKPVKIENKK